jgi:hypothetical protein
MRYVFVAERCVAECDGGESAGAAKNGSRKQWCLRGSAALCLYGSGSSFIGEETTNEEEVVAIEQTTT